MERRLGELSRSELMLGGRVDWRVWSSIDGTCGFVDLMRRGRVRSAVGASGLNLPREAG